MARDACSGFGSRPACPLARVIARVVPFCEKSPAVYWSFHYPVWMGPLAAVVADTHIPRRAAALPEKLVRQLERVDLILHAGDLMEPTLLDVLAAYAPTRAVRGNLDPPESTLPEALAFEFGGASVAMTHDSGPKKGRRNRMKRRFPGARVVVFGHSHIPWLEDEDRLMLLNPGSPTDRRSQPDHTFALLRAEGGEVTAEIVVL